MADTAKIIYDHREEKSTIPAKLTLLGVETESAQLPLGDYIISDSIVVERKSAEDLSQSITNGRLFDQSYRIVEEYDNPILIVEGTPRLPENAVDGALVSVVRKGFSIWRVKDINETARILNRLALAEVKKKRSLVIKGSRKSKADPERTALNALATIPGISADRSSKLLNHFGSLREVTQANTQELQAVGGIGKKTAEEIIKAFSFNFKDPDSFKELDS